ncbi:MAG: hypothetical protein AAGK97_10225, partial [Bacteroidota bacterium]
MRDIILQHRLPPGMEYVPGTYQFSVPGIGQGGTFETVDDPFLQGRWVTQPISPLDSILQNVGLVGSKDVSNNIVNIKFDVALGCSFRARSRPIFRLLGRSNCGDRLLPSITKRAPRVRLRGADPNFRTNLNITDLNINPCNSATQTINASGSITQGTTTGMDSITITLPPYAMLVPGSYNPLLNLPAATPVETTTGTETLITVPLQTLNVGDNFAFSLDVVFGDNGSTCDTDEYSIETASTIELFCDALDDFCSVKSVASSQTRDINIVKPELTFGTFDGELTLDPATDQAFGSFTVEVCNSGAPVMANDTVKFGIYEDVDMDGSRTQDDSLLSIIAEPLDADLNTGECITLMVMDTFASGSICKIIGVIAPDIGCVCDEDPSAQLRPEIIIDFDMEPEVCSRGPVDFGPDPIDGYEYEWVSVNSSDLTALSSTTTTPVTYTAIQNTTGAPIEVQYALRTSVASCFAFDTVTVTVFPEMFDSLSVQACIGDPFNLPAPMAGGTNFMWDHTTNLTFPGPDSGFVILDPVSVDTVYKLNYIDANGCPGSHIVNVNAIDCGTAFTALGDTVWFDFNKDGMQDPNEPG